MLEEFPRWFLNLKFVESKIHVTGPADLLSDLRKYRKYIAVKVHFNIRKYLDTISIKLYIIILYKACIIQTKWIDKFKKNVYPILINKHK